MRKFVQNKLWRDRIPEKLQKMGSIIHIKRLSDAEYDLELRIKLLEEAEEVKQAQSQKELIEELADVFEVIDALCALHSITSDDIKKIQAAKRAERGGFFDRTYVTVAEHLEGSWGVEYCLANPEKYPEII